MRWGLGCFVVTVLLSTAACSRPQPLAASQEPTNADLENLQGDWRIEASWCNGVPEPAVARSVSIRFRGNKFIVLDRDGNPQVETIELFPDCAPKAIDRRGTDGTPSSPGIYSLEGDRFTWCSALAGNHTRPTTFTSKPGSRRSLMILRRVRKKRAARLDSVTR